MKNESEIRRLLEITDRFLDKKLIGPMDEKIASLFVDGKFSLFLAKEIDRKVIADYVVTREGIKLTIDTLRWVLGETDDIPYRFDADKLEEDEKCWKGGSQ